MKTFNLIIKGDMNDADYVSQSIPFDENDEIPILPTLKDSVGNHYDAQPWKYKTFAKMFGCVLARVAEQYPNKHNWQREIDENDQYKIRTIANFVKCFYGIRLEDLNLQNDDLSASEIAIGEISEYLEMEFLPSDNDGNLPHTITRISVVPTAAEEVFYANR